MKITGFVTSKVYLAPQGDFKTGMHILEIEGLKVFVGEQLAEQNGLDGVPLGETVVVDVRVSYRKDKPPSFWAQQFVFNGNA